VIYLSAVLEIILIDPDKRKRAIKCSECGLSYSAKDYRVLYDNKKLIFFKFKFPNRKTYKTFCHSCIVEYIHKNFPFDKELPIKIITTKYEYVCKLYHSDDPDDTFGLSDGDLFK